MTLLVTVPEPVAKVAVMFVLLAATLVANPLPLLRPVLIVAALVFDDIQLTAFVTSRLIDPLA
jgi:hypothetical protein